MPGNHKSSIMIDHIISIARLNDGYIHLGSLVPKLKEMGFLKSAGNSEPQRTIIKALRASGQFEISPIGNSKNSGVWRHKDFII